MSRLLALLLLALLTGCGGSDSPSSGGQSQAPTPPAQGDLSDLNGLPAERAIRAMIPRLAKEPGLQDPAGLAKSLNQKWKITCGHSCLIERK
jgi:hypothetical protein